MGMFDRFPYSNRQQLNLDWMIKKLKEIEELVKTFGTTTETAEITLSVGESQIPITLTKIGKFVVMPYFNIPTQDFNVSTSLTIGYVPSGFFPGSYTYLPAHAALSSISESPHIGISQNTGKIILTFGNYATYGETINTSIECGQFIYST